MIAGGVSNIGGMETGGEMAAAGGQMGPSGGQADQGGAPAEGGTDEGPPSADTVILSTSLGDITLVLDPERAPDTVANFLAYVDAGFYDGLDGGGATIFHRVIAGFMIQGGGFTAAGQGKETRPPVRHEGDTGIPNLRGTIAMARTPEPNSATSQFFINHQDNPGLDYVSPGEPGYVTFGRVVDGLEVVDAIATVPTGAMDVPLEPVTLTEVRRAR